MYSANYLEMLPLSSITKYAKGRPNDGLPFTGYPRVHPSEKDKLILVNDPLGPDPTVLEFRLEDVIFVEDVPSAVTEAGEGVPLVRLWIQKGAVGMILEPFEVNDPLPDAGSKGPGSEVSRFPPVQISGKVRKIKEHILQNVQNWPGL